MIIKETTEQRNINGFYIRWFKKSEGVTREV